MRRRFGYFGSRRHNVEERGAYSIYSVRTYGSLSFGGGCEAGFAALRYLSSWAQRLSDRGTTADAGFGCADSVYDGLRHGIVPGVCAQFGEDGVHRETDGPGDLAAAGGDY